MVALASGLAIAAAVVWFVGREGPADGTGAAPFVGGDLHSLVSAPGAAGRIFTGGHQGVASSDDAGRTWTQVDSLQDADAMGWAFLDGAIWMSGHPGLEVSTDGGRTFEQRNDGLPATDIHALGGSGSILYAASPAAGFLVSTDAGDSWEVRNPSVGQGFMGAMLVDPADTDRVVAAEMSAGAVESADGGRSWRVLGGVPSAMWVSWDPSNVDRIVVTGLGIAAVSRDGGETWRSVDVPTGVTVVQIEPDPERWFAGALSDDGTVDVSVSRDRGRTWARP